MTDRQDNSTIFVYHDDGNLRGSIGTYVTNLVAALSNLDSVEVVNNPEIADVIHINDLNILGSLTAGGKESRKRHFWNLYQAFAKQYDTPVVITDHGVIHATEHRDHAYGAAYNYGDILSRGICATMRAVGVAADAIIADSQSHRDSIIDFGISQSKVSAIYHGVGEEFHNNTPTDITDPFILHVSTYGGKKNPQAVYEISQKFPGNAIIVGKGWPENTPPEILADETVEIPGYISKERLIELYNRATALFMPVLYETFCFPLAEAMSCGTPVVGSDEFAVPEIINNAGIIHPANETGKFVDSLQMLVEDKSKREELEKEALACADVFSWERCARETKEVYMSVV